MNLHLQARCSLVRACLWGTIYMAVACFDAAALNADANFNLERFGSVPLHFEQNQGQVDASVQYLTRGRGYTMGLLPNEAKLVLTSHAPDRSQSTISTVTVRLLGGNPNAMVRGADPLPGVVNHFVGNDPSRWRTNIQTFGKVRYERVYPGIDLVYYGNQKELEYDFIVSAHADPSIIRLSFEGQNDLTLNSEGDLLLNLGDSVLKNRRPILWQERHGERVFVEGRFVKHGSREVGFEVGPYDRSLPLVIDPVLEYSTYLGSTATDGVTGIDVDASGNVVVVGYTGSAADFPFANAYLDDTAQRIEAGNAFVTRLSPTGTLIYSTYLGGEEHDEARAVALDNASNAYVTGTTHSIPAFGDQGFPVTQGAYMTTFRGFSTAFVAKLSAGGGLVYSTFLFTDQSGGAYNGVAIDVDGEGFAYVASQKGGSQSFVTKLNLGGSGLVYTNNIFNAVTWALSVDTTGAAHLAGNTVAGSESQFFQTTTNAYETNSSNFQGARAFYLKLDETGTNRVYCTLFASRNESRARGIAVDGLGRAHVTGSLRAPNNPSNLQYGDFRPRNAFQAQFGGGLTDAFIARFDPALSGTNSLLYASYLGGSHDESGFAIRVDDISQMYVAGRTTSTNFPTASATQTNYAGGISDAFVTQLNSAGTGLIFSTYLGGEKEDVANAVTVGLSGLNVYVGGTTDSSAFPTLNAIQPTPKPFLEGFVARFRMVEPELTFTVNSNNDLDDGTCDTAHCSLREAIIAANRTPGLQTIDFNIPGTNIPVIVVQSRLPDVTEPVRIDATTQPGTKLVHLADGSILDDFSGLSLKGGGAEVRGFIITDFDSAGIQIEGNGTNIIQGNYIGIKPDGSGLGNERAGIAVFNSIQNRIGGSDVKDRNVISRNDTYGIILAEGANENEIYGNIIGADPTGTLARPNRLGGILVGAYANRIGAPTSAPGQPPGNLISGNSSGGLLFSSGVHIAGPGTFANLVEGNLIGTTLDGTAPLPNFRGVWIEKAPRNRIGGQQVGSRNIISGNSQHGIFVEGFAAQENLIQGNFIGTDISGFVKLPNSGSGLQLEDKSIVGGSSPQPGAPPGNVISGNGESGILIVGSENQVQGNTIGLDKDGALPVGNVAEGIHISAISEPAYANLIGGRTAGVRNIISGNEGNGIYIEAPAAAASSKIDLFNQIEGNIIGGSLSGFPAFNEFCGIEIFEASGNIVGGDVPEAANTIQFNLEDGVRINGTFGRRNRISGNSISGNFLLGIELGPVGVTPNDLLDLDSGANLLQNFPDTLRAIDFGDSILVSGFLDSPSNKVYRVEIFGNTVCDSSGNGEGETMLDAQHFQLRAPPNERFFSTLPKPSVGFITSTVTDESGNTSEFSACAPIRPISDSDGDRSDDYIEETAPNNGDANRDGVPDKQQPNVSSGVSMTSQAFITAEAPAPWVIRDFSVPLVLQHLAVFLAKWQFALDFFRMQIEMSLPPQGLRANAAPASVPVVLHLPPGANVNTCVLFGPTPDNPTPHWYEFLYDGATGAVFEGNKVTLHFVDGQRGDHDLAANGKIETAGGLALSGDLPVRITDFSRLGLNRDYLRVSAAAGRTYSIQRSSDLQNWTVVGTRTTPNGIFDFIHTRTANNNDPVQFYRVGQAP